MPLFANTDLPEVLPIMQHLDRSLSISDSGADVSEIIDTSIPTLVLAHRIQREQAISLEQSVRMLIYGRPALGLPPPTRSAGRQIADMVVFDTDHLSAAISEVGQVCRGWYETGAT